MHFVSFLPFSVDVFVCWRFIAVLYGASPSDTKGTRNLSSEIQSVLFVAYSTKANVYKALNKSQAWLRRMGTHLPYSRKTKRDTQKM